MMQLTRGGLVLVERPSALDEARRAFDEQHCVRLPGFLEPSLLAAIQRLVDDALFFDRTHEGIGDELCLAPGPLTAGLEFLWNDPALLEAIARLTGCGPFGCFEGRVYRMRPGAGHYDSWHSDVGEGRRVAMSVNLSRGAYAGGVTEFRRADSPEPFYSVANTGPGDAIVFRVDPALRHRVTDVTGSAEKTALAGWFRTSPDFATLFRERHPDL